MSDVTTGRGDFEIKGNWLWLTDLIEKWLTGVGDGEEIDDLRSKVQSDGLGVLDEGHGVLVSVGRTRHAAAEDLQVPAVESRVKGRIFNNHDSLRPNDHETDRIFY